MIDLKHLYKKLCYNFNIAYRPLRLNFTLTDYCNLRCPTCSKWKETNPKAELSKEQWKRIINKISGFGLSPLVVLTGGEPFSRKDIFDIIGYIVDAGLQPVILSNGSLLNQVKISKLQKYPIRQITLSLNGVRAATHEITRGVGGCFEKTLTSLDILANTQIPVVIETILMKPNMGEIIDLVKLAKKKKIKGIAFQVLTASNVHNIYDDKKNSIPEEQWYKSDPFWIDDAEAFTSLVEELIYMKRNGFPIINSLEQMKYFPLYFRDQRRIAKLPCMAGIGNFMVDPYGQVRQCYSLMPIGNILKQKPLDIWRSKTAKEVRQQIRTCKATCRLLNNTW
jgi:MoaA/NifB/PqqE/SkfB family radical SAM enzyme